MSEDKKPRIHYDLFELVNALLHVNATVPRTVPLSEISDRIYHHSKLISPEETWTTSYAAKAYRTFIDETLADARTGASLGALYVAAALLWYHPRASEAQKVALYDARVLAAAYVEAHEPPTNYDEAHAALLAAVVDAWYAPKGGNP